MSKDTEHPVAVLREYFNYNPETGIVTWAKGRGCRARVNTRAGCVVEGGYRVIGLCGKRMLEHRLAWAMHYGAWPVGSIDHFDGDTSNNRIDNLRLATAAENNASRRKVRSDSTHELFYPGVYWGGEGSTHPFARDGAAWPWMVRHHRDGKTIWRTSPDLLSAVALKMRLQAGAPIPPRGKKNDAARTTTTNP